MINFIGAYVFTVWIAAIVTKRRAIAAFLVRLERSTLQVKFIIVLLLVWMTILQAHLVNPEEVSLTFSLPQFLLSALTLWMHEAGHIYWMFLGTFFNVLGGTLNEILFPLVLLILAVKAKRTVGCALSVYWLGFNLFGIGRYVADAQERALPLLGTDGDGHDWAILLEMTGMSVLFQLLS